MSRIGQKQIVIPPAVSVSLNGNIVEVSGPKGKLGVILNKGIKVEMIDNRINVTTTKDNTYQKALSGLNRTNISNAIYGVTDLWQKSLEMVGVGFRAEGGGQELKLSLGFSHPVIIKAPDGISFSISENKITVSGANKYLVGEEAAKIRRLKPPEPYKGKGIKYVGEKIRKKAGKAKALAGTTGAK